MEVRGRQNRILGRFERLDKFLMPFWRVLRASCAEKVANMWSSWAQLGPQLGTQNEPKSKQKSINFCMLLGIGFLGTLVDF